ncbi:MAG: membrane protease YdiL (CAAX protease family) [Verrucomicrobiales bacterium]
MKSIFQKEIVKISLYFTFILLFGALIAPGLFNLGKGLAGMRIVSEDGYLHKVLTQSDFKRYFNRAMLLAALIGLVPLLRSLKMRKADMGMVPNARWLSQVIFGFISAAGLLLLMGAGYVALKIFGYEFDLGGSAIVTVIISAVSVALLEEFFFRGAIFGLALRTMKPTGALIFVTFFYTIVHFLKPPNSVELPEGTTIAMTEADAGKWKLAEGEEVTFARGGLTGSAVVTFTPDVAKGSARLSAAPGFDPGYLQRSNGKRMKKIDVQPADVDWGSGFWMVGQIFKEFGNPLFILSQFVTLFAVGWILGVARLRTNSLWLSIGLHCGWVFGLKFFSKLTLIPVALQRGEYLPWVGRDLKEGLVPLVFVIITGVIVFTWLRKSGMKPPDSDLIAENEYKVT